MIVYALGETWFAVFGGLIPIIGLVGICWILYRAIGPNDGDDE
jgi:flagellar biogenesis protein FliO